MATNRTFAVVIPTYRRPDLLSRLLDSLVEAIHPVSMLEVIVVENGDSHDAESVVKFYIDKIKLRYIYISEPSVSKARNAGIKATNADHYIFFDNDVRLGRETLVAYDDAFQRNSNGHFFGGQLLIDYEDVPSPWLLPYLPCSARGFNLGQDQELSEPILLGGNFSLSAEQIRRVGLFDEQCAVGENGGFMGEETRIQRELLTQGCTGLYLHDAVVWHYVPKDRCSAEWMLKRSYRHGLTEASQISLQNYDGKLLFNIPRWILVRFLISLSECWIHHPFADEKTRFKYRNTYSIAKGMLYYFLGKHRVK